MPQCYFLTPDDLNNMLSNGATLIGGPFASQQDCDANCGASSSSGSGSQSSSSSGGSGSGSGSGSSSQPICGCCGSFALPQSLTMTITGCACINGTYSANYVPAYNAWQCASGNFNFVLLCGGPSSFTLEDTHLLDNTVPQAPCQVGSTFTSNVTCNPFQAIFATSTNPGTSCCCGSGVTNITVTFSGASTGDVCSSCCPGTPIPATLTATIASACSAINGTTITMTFNSGTHVWSGNNGSFLTLALQCVSPGTSCNNLQLTYECGFSYTLNPTSCSCNPFSLDFNGPASETGGQSMCGFCANGQTWTVTITP